MSKHFLEPAAQEFADAASELPYLYEVGHEAARKVLDEVQAAPIAMPAVADRWITVSTVARNVPVRIVKPAGADEILPVIQRCPSRRG